MIELAKVDNKEYYDHIRAYQTLGYMDAAIDMFAAMWEALDIDRTTCGYYPSLEDGIAEVMDKLHAMNRELMDLRGQLYARILADTGVVR